MEVSDPLMEVVKGMTHPAPLVAMDFILDTMDHPEEVKMDPRAFPLAIRFEGHDVSLAKIDLSK
ncbi:Hypothetical protein FKW44_017045 [Caligus rogercresseyi]|uniref:Uncharacterized protein n=1 Tax=Caligus rogercresseyi TaxID=217165 RepID=A0A7T8H306_CALRO|nr:Hypothetical protein FKW44_017045 [Caligus rogercresseyi]